MAKKTYRVIQWATGVVGQTALKHFIENPVLELVGVYVTNPAKVGKDAGALVGLPPTTGVIATNDVEKIVAMDADCVLFAQLTQDIDMVCRLLRSGKNVISPMGPFYRIDRNAAEYDRIEAACREGGTSFHGAGVHPGFSGDILPITLSRLMNRVERIEVSEIIDKIRNPMIWTNVMGFGLPMEELRAKPKRSPEAPYFFLASMNMIADALGKKIDNLTTKLELAEATADITHDFGFVPKGTVGGQHFEWTAWSDGKPFIIYHFYWSLGENVNPRWDNGESKYRVVMVGDPDMEVHVMGGMAEDGRRPFHGLPWTGLLGATAVPAVCDAAPGVVTHFDLGLMHTRGVARS